MSKRELENLFDEIKICKKCLDFKDKIHWPTYIGIKYPQKKILIIGQNPGKAKYSSIIDNFNNYEEYSKWFSSLYNNDTKWKEEPIILTKRGWLKKAKLDINDVAFTDLIKCQGIKPSDKIAKTCIVHLENEIKTLQPDLIITLGLMARNSVKNMIKMGVIRKDTKIINMLHPSQFDVTKKWNSTKSIENKLK